jgi:hypothetical protein
MSGRQRGAFCLPSSNCKKTPIDQSAEHALFAADTLEKEPVVETISLPPSV